MEKFRWQTGHFSSVSCVKIPGLTATPTLRAYLAFSLAACLISAKAEYDPPVWHASGVVSLQSCQDLIF